MSSPPTEFDLAMMRRAISLAMRGRGYVEPNPMVGCVIVKDGRVIGEGYHERFGGPHAEPTALGNCTEPPAGATAYVTLEPCCHTNKKTPPCVPQVIAAGIKRVVVGTLDPNPAVNGQGIEQLRAAGVDVVAPALDAEAKQLIAPFIARVRLKRPYVTLKWAETADGKIAGPGGNRLQISNDSSSRRVHELRARSNAVMVGINTVLTDDPLLTARGVAVTGQPLAIVIDAGLRLPMTSRLVSERPDDLRVYCSYTAYNRVVLDDAKALQNREVLVIPLNANGAHLPLGDVIRDYGHAPDAPTHLLVEPGPTLAAGFFAENAADRLWVFRSPKRFDHESAPAAARIPASYAKTSEVDLDGDVLTEYINTASPVFFAPVESADFVRVRDAVQNGRD